MSYDTYFLLCNLQHVYLFPHACCFMITRWLLYLQVSLSMFQANRQRKYRVQKAFPQETLPFYYTRNTLSKDFYLHLFGLNYVIWL